MGKRNIAGGLFLLGAFAAYGFVLIYLRDFAPDRAAWIAAYADGAHFESRLAHVHGNLFALLNILLGWLLLELPIRNSAAISWLALTGMLMPVGILAEVYAGAPPVLVLIGGVAMVVAILWSGVEVARLRLPVEAAQRGHGVN